MEGDLFLLDVLVHFAHVDLDAELWVLLAMEDFNREDQQAEVLLLWVLDGCRSLLFLGNGRGGMGSLRLERGYVGL